MKQEDLHRNSLLSQGYFVTLSSEIIAFTISSGKCQ